MLLTPNPIPLFTIIGTRIAYLRQFGHSMLMDLNELHQNAPRRFNKHNVPAAKTCRYGCLRHRLARASIEGLRPHCFQIVHFKNYVAKSILDGSSQALFVNGVFKKVHVFVPQPHQDHAEVMLIDSKDFIDDNATAERFDKRDLGFKVWDFGRYVPEFHSPSTDSHTFLLKSVRYIGEQDKFQNARPQ